MASLFSTRFKACVLGSFTLMVLAAIGCSGEIPKSKINGTVTFKGKPLQSGKIKFVGTKGAAIANIKADGTFTITDVVVPDEFKVGVTKPMGGTKVDSERPHFEVPEKYGDPNTSGLQYSVTAQTKELNIEIK